MPPSAERTRRVLAATAGAAATGAAALAAWGVLCARRRLFVREEDVEVEAPAAPELRVAHLSDLHLGRLAHVHRAAAREVNAFAPHLIALTGDLVQGRGRLSDLDAFLGLLDPGAALVAVPGNWDYGAGVMPHDLDRVLGGRGGRLLVNESMRLHVDGRDVLLTGLDDPVKGRPDLGVALAGAAPPDLHLLLVHAPAWRDGMAAATTALAARSGERRARALRPHLILAGHTHGGQVYLGPWSWTPAGSGDYVRGWYLEGDAVPMYVSPGLGSAVPLRVGSLPEVALFRLGPAGDPP